MSLVNIFSPVKKSHFTNPLHCFLSVFVSRRRYEGINDSLEFFAGVSCSRHGVSFFFPEFVSIISAAC